MLSRRSRVEFVATLWTGAVLGGWFFNAGSPHVVSATWLVGICAGFDAYPRLTHLRLVCLMLLLPLIAFPFGVATDALWEHLAWRPAIGIPVLGVVVGSIFGFVVDLVVPAFTCDIQQRSENLNGDS